MLHWDYGICQIFCAEQQKHCVVLWETTQCFYISARKNFLREACLFCHRIYCVYTPSILETIGCESPFTEVLFNYIDYAEMNNL